MYGSVKCGLRLPSSKGPVIYCGAHDQRRYAAIATKAAEGLPVQVACRLLEVTASGGQGAPLFEQSNGSFDEIALLVVGFGKRRWSPAA